MRKLFILLAAVLLAAFLAACDKKEKPVAPAPTPAPTMEIELGTDSPMPDDMILAYLEKKTAKAARADKGNVDRLQMNLKQHFGCLEKYKADTCRFMLCSPPAIYAGDEAYQFGKYDDAFAYYTAAFNLLKEEVADDIQKRNQREADYNKLKSTAAATDDDTRLYLYRRAILTQLLFRNQAEVARLMERLALCFDEQNAKEEATNARAAADAFLTGAVDEYRNYYAVRKQLVARLVPGDPKQGDNYLAELENIDQLMIVRHF